MEPDDCLRIFSALKKLAGAIKERLFRRTRNLRLAFDNCIEEISVIVTFLFR
jgi:hypothetical protein